MTLASHARGPEFEPRCEYYQNFCEHFFCHPEKFFARKTQFCHPEIFFPQKHVHFGKKEEFIPKSVTPHSFADRGFTICIRLKRLWSWYKPVLRLTTSFMERCGIVAYKFFQNWLRVSRAWFSISIYRHRRTKSLMGMGKAGCYNESIVSLFKEIHNGQGKT